MPPPRLSNLPDLCLLAIFKYLSLTELIRHIGLVCSNWSRVQRDELKRRGQITKHLVILQSFDPLFHFIRRRENQYESDLIEYVRDDNGLPWAQLPQLDEFNTLQVPGDVLTESFTSPLIALLPNITRLTIFQDKIKSIDSVVVSLEQIVRLLNHYAPKLVSLKLHFITHTSIQTRHYNHELSVRALFNAINRLNSLRHLSLDVQFPYYKAQSRLRILSRLSTFTVHYVEPVSILTASLSEFATTGNVRINCDTAIGIRRVGEIIQLDPQVATKFIRSSFSFHDEDNPQQFFTRFNSLTTLSLKVHMPMTMLAQYLSLLPHLISLSLEFIHFIHEDENTPQPEIVQVPSVRLITLTIQAQSHLHTERLHLHRIFPNLQVLHLIQISFKCSECQYELFNESEAAVGIYNCMVLARQPFRACANLHTVKLDISRIFPDIPEEVLTVDQWHDHDSHLLAEYKRRYLDPAQLPSTTFSIIKSFIRSIFGKILSYILPLWYKIFKKPHNS